MATKKKKGGTTEGAVVTVRQPDGGEIEYPCGPDHPGIILIADDGKQTLVLASCTGEFMTKAILNLLKANPKISIPVILGALLEGGAKKPA